jgi:hypothetical protein
MKHQQLVDKVNTCYFIHLLNILVHEIDVL